MNAGAIVIFILGTQVLAISQNTEPRTLY